MRTKDEATALITDTSRELFKIDYVSKLLGVHQQTLRNWERKKLVIPLRAGSIRIYTVEHIDLCRKIKEFSGKGIPLNGIKKLLQELHVTRDTDSRKDA